MHAPAGWCPVWQRSPAPDLEGRCQQAQVSVLQVSGQHASVVTLQSEAAAMTGEEGQQRLQRQLTCACMFGVPGCCRWDLDTVDGIDLLASFGTCSS
jgi:hypothetical protein